MNRYSDSAIRDLLTPKQTPKPPAGLAERIQKEIPERLEAAPAVVAPAGPTRLRRYLLAASVLATIGGAVVLYRVWQSHPAPAVAEEPEPAPDENLHALGYLEDAAPPPPPPPAPPLGRPPVRENVPSPAAAPSATADAQGSLRRSSVATGGEAGRGSDAERRRFGQMARNQRLEVEREELSRQLAELRRPVRRLPPADELTPPGDSPYDAVYFRDYGPNHFVDTEDDALSTFGLDVDTASYAVVRRSLRDGRLPDPAAVRVEELVNHFDYGDPPPERGDFAIHAEGAPSPFGEGERYYLLRFHLRGRELASAERRLTIAAEARVQVEPDPRAVSRYRLVGYESREVADERFRDDTVDAGEIGAGHAVTALYEVELSEGWDGRGTLATFRLRYGSVISGEVVEAVRTVTGDDIAATWDEASAALRLTSLVAELGEILKRSHWARTGDLDDLFRRAQKLAPEFPGDAEVAELVSLIGKAARYAR